MKRNADDVMSRAQAVKCDLAAEVLRSFGSLRFSATGWSMLPTIWPGDTLMVERARSDEIRVGEVVLVGRDGRLCAHRVVAKPDGSGKMWVTRGDAMSAPDRPSFEDQVLGRVAYLIRAGRLIAVPAEMSMVKNLAAKIVQHSIPAARALVFMRQMTQGPEKSHL
jgi:signal peptidase I